jgi:crossover junction endodeoxyribonuclease RusA
VTLYTLDLPWPRPPLTLNQRWRWEPKARLTAEIRETVAWLAKGARIPTAGFARVQLHYAPGRQGRIDPMNLCATSKPAIDGLVDAGVVDDDDSRHVHEQTPEIHFPPEPGPRCWLTVDTGSETA